MKYKTLTIAIPTFNGSKHIREAIDSVTTQTEDKYSDFVEIIISDNASTDATESITKDCKSRSRLSIKYFKNAENIGYDRNVDNLFKVATGDFVWLLGDDDYLKPGAISRYFELMETYQNVAVILLSVEFLDIVSGKTSQMIKFDKDSVFNNGDDFFKECSWGAAALSSLIIRRSDWNAQSLSRYFGNQWIHVAGIVHILASNKPSYIVSKIMVNVRVSSDRWARNGNQLMLAYALLDVFRNMKSLGYKEETYQFFANDRFRRSLFEIIHLRPQTLNGRYILAKRMMLYHGGYAAFWLLHIPILFMPDPILNLMRDIRRNVLKFSPKVY